jgi:hypothetical protein
MQFPKQVSRSKFLLLLNQIEHVKKRQYMIGGGNFSSYDASYMVRIANDAFRRKEVFKLYLEILRTIRLFTWTDENGVPWSQLLKMSAREEFESSKQEKDPYILAQALVNARMALDDLQEKYKKQQIQIQQNIEKHVEQTRVDRNRAINIKQHEVFERQFDPNQAINPFFNMHNSSKNKN